MNHNVFAAIRGFLGGLSGAFLGGLLWVKLCAVYAVIAVFIPPFALLFLLLATIIGPFACFGYWLFRGLKHRKFAYISIHICAFLGTSAAVFCVFWPQGGPWCLLFGGFAILFAGGWAQVRLLRYTDPAWYADPRRIAVIRAGGLLYNHRGKKIYAPLEHLPPVFSVGKALEVKGQILRTTPNLRKSRTFLVDDVAGVILGPANGSNVLFDREHEVLAKFAWSQKNANLLAQLLEEHGVHFYTCEEYGYSLGAAASSKEF